jgi:hypothetical protein
MPEIVSYLDTHLDSDGTFLRMRVREAGRAAPAGGLWQCLV